MWLGTDGGGVVRYDGKEFKTFTTREGLAHDVVKAIAEDQQGRLWFGTQGGGVSCYKSAQIPHRAFVHLWAGVWAAGC